VAKLVIEDALGGVTRGTRVHTGECKLVCAMVSGGVCASERGGLCVGKCGG